jgi:hypothetical protein
VAKFPFSSTSLARLHGGGALLFSLLLLNVPRRQILLESLSRLFEGLDAFSQVLDASGFAVGFVNCIERAAGDGSGFFIS